MALLAVDGFDVYQTTLEAFNRRGYLQWTVGGDGCSLQPGRIAGAGQGQSLKLPDYNFVASTPPKHVAVYARS